MDVALTPAQSTLQHTQAAHASWAKTSDRAARTRPGRAAFMARFERQVDPDGTLHPEEKGKRAEHAFKAYMLGLAYKASRAKSKAAAARRQAAALDSYADTASAELAAATELVEGTERASAG